MNTMGYSFFSDIWQSPPKSSSVEVALDDDVDSTQFAGAVASAALFRSSLDLHGIVASRDRTASTQGATASFSFLSDMW